MNLLERTSFPDTLGRDWVFVRMHDAVQRCLACMIADGHRIKPTSALHSAAMSPKHAEALRNSPMGRRSSLGGPEDTEATWLSPTGPFASAREPLMSCITPASSMEAAVVTAGAGPSTTARNMQADFAGNAAAASGFGHYSGLHSVSSGYAHGSGLSVRGNESSLHDPRGEYRNLDGTPKGTATLQQQSRGGNSCITDDSRMSHGLRPSSIASLSEVHEQRFAEVVLMAGSADSAGSATAGGMAAVEASIAAPNAAQGQNGFPVGSRPGIP